MGGWEKGKGLGSSLQGKTDPVKVAYKDDAKGMGYKGNPDQLAAHQSEFDALLSSLNSDNNRENTKPTQSLEKQSKSSKSRVHYHKSTRAKDVSNYSANDISSILGVKKSKKTKPNQPDTSSQPPVEMASSNIIINAGSITDYFNAKMLKLKQAAIHPKPEDTNHLLATTSHSDASDDTQEMPKETKKRKKEKKKKKARTLPVVDQNDTSSDVATKNFFADKMQSIYKDEASEPKNKKQETVAHINENRSHKRTSNSEGDCKKIKKRKKEKNNENKASCDTVVDKKAGSCEDSIHTFFSAKMQSLYSKT